VSTPNQETRAPRDFPSKAAWEVQSKAEFMARLDAALSSFEGEMDVEVRGDATATVEVTLSENVTINGEAAYCYQFIDLGGHYRPAARPASTGDAPAAPAVDEFKKLRALAERLADGLSHVGTCRECGEMSPSTCTDGGQEAMKALKDYNDSIPEINCHGLPEDRAALQASPSPAPARDGGAA
jgi:hypothetical protein